MKNFYIVFEIDHYVSSIFDNEATRQHYADILKVGTGDNVYRRLDNIAGLQHANICESRQKALEIREAWNNQYKAAGTYGF